MTDNGTLLVVEDDEEMRLFLQEELRERGYRVIGAARGPEALERLGGDPVDAVITDLKMPEMQGDELLAELRARDRDLPVVMITAFGSIDSAVEAIKAGAYHYLAKPFRIEQLLATVENALREKRLKEEVRELREAFEDQRFTIVARSTGMKNVLDLVRRAAAGRPRRGAVVQSRAAPRGSRAVESHRRGRPVRLPDRARPGGPRGAARARLVRTRRPTSRADATPPPGWPCGRRGSCPARPRPDEVGLV